jgi:hypothetical protein
VKVLFIRRDNYLRTVYDNGILNTRLSNEAAASAALQRWADEQTVATGSECCHDDRSLSLRRHMHAYTRTRCHSLSHSHAHTRIHTHTHSHPPTPTYQDHAGIHVSGPRGGMTVLVVSWRVRVVQRST